MKIIDTYTLIRKDIPVIEFGEVVSDPEVGGIKLVYWKRTMVCKELNLGLFRITYPIYIYKRTKIAFLKPFKEKWDTKRNRLDRCFWGKKDHPLTNMWIIVTPDYKKWSDTIVRFKDQIKDHKIIAFLKSNAETFSTVKFLNKR